MRADGITEKNRRLLDILNREMAGPFSIVEAGKVLGLPLEKTRRLLVYWESRGWLSRLHRGLYITVPLGAVNPAEYAEDPWIVAANLFEPCYIGGWSAAEHWQLTEQIFKDVSVFTSYRFRHTRKVVKGIAYILHHIGENEFFGVSTVWRRSYKIQVSDPSKTISDILNFPSAAGGIRHAAEIVRSYFESEYKNEKLLLEYLELAGNKTAYKRLGFIVEKTGITAPDVLAACAENISKGLSRLDPGIKPCGKIVRRWNLRVNVELGE